MKLFSDMTPLEKLEHIKACAERAKSQCDEDMIYAAEIMDFWDYWIPYMLKRMRKLEAVAEAAYKSESAFKSIDDGFFTGLVPPEFALVSGALRALESDT